MFRSNRAPSEATPESAPVAGLRTPAFCISIDIAPDPGSMARVLEQFARRGLLPTRWHSDVVGSCMMQIDVQIDGLPAALGEDIARCLRSIVGVQSVLTAGKVNNFGHASGCP